MTVAALIYAAAGSPPMDGTQAGVCRLCGTEGVGVPFGAWAKETFTDGDKLRPGEIVCHACQFCAAEAVEELTRRVGQWWPDARAALAVNQDRIEAWRRKKRTPPDAMPEPREIGVQAMWGGYAVPQKFRNYSHFVVRGVWVPLSKGDKAQMRGLLLSTPDVALIAVSGQKHLFFRSAPGWWQIEEQFARPFPEQLTATLALIEPLYQGGITKAEIESGRYEPRRVLAYGLDVWHYAEQQIMPLRGTLRLQLALFLAQKGDPDGTAEDC
jgi:hypothetical protein